MPFNLKNAVETYQRFMDVVFSDQTVQNREVYTYDMVVNTSSNMSHREDLLETLESIRKFNMCMNPAKCFFGVQAGKFLGFMLTQRGIEANL